MLLAQDNTLKKIRPVYTFVRGLGDRTIVWTLIRHSGSPSDTLLQRSPGFRIERHKERGSPFTLSVGQVLDRVTVSVS